MVKIVFFKRGKDYYGFREIGHAGYDEPGKDIVCAAVSAMTMLVINTIEVVWGSNVEYTVDDKTSDITVRALGALEAYSSDEKTRYAISGLIYSYFLQLNDMLEDYYDFLDVSVEED